MNPFAMLGVLGRLEGAHPKAAAFVKNELMTGLPAGTIIEMTVTKPGLEPKTTNIKLTQEDLDMLNELKGMNGKQ